MPKEIIPDADDVSRAMIEPEAKIDDTFRITKLFESLSRGESLFWRKYADAERIHEFGRQKVAARPNKTYLGFATAQVLELRKLRTARGHGVKVEHEPEEGDWHAELHYSPNGDLKPGDKNEIKLFLMEIFNNRVQPA